MIIYLCDGFKVNKDVIYVTKITKSGKWNGAKLDPFSLYIFNLIAVKSS